MPTLEHIRATPWLIDQKTAGNCGFVAVVQHLVRKDAPFLHYLLACLNEPIVGEDPSIPRIRQSLRNRRNFNFPGFVDDDDVFPINNENDYLEWYLPVALTIIFKRTCVARGRRDILEECERLSAILQPGWGRGQRLGEAANRIQVGNEAFHIVRGELDNTYKSGSLGVGIPEMDFLLRMCNIQPMLAWPIRCWDKYSYQTLLEIFSSSGNTFAREKSRLKEHWEMEFISKLDDIAEARREPKIWGAIVAIKIIKWQPELPDSLKACEFHHWVYCCQGHDQNYELWSFGRRFILQRKTIFQLRLTTQATRRIFLPVCVIALD